MSETNGNGKASVTEYYRLHRPTRFKDVLGQEQAVKVLRGMCEQSRVPHALLVAGPSGTGKTTLARILKEKLGCSDADFTEVNCGVVESPIDEVRAIQKRMNLKPMGGACRIWLLDEAQALVRAKGAQEGLLKILEDSPTHAYFIICTTEPDKLLPTIVNRCTRITTKKLTPSLLKQVLAACCAKEGLKLPPSVADRIIECADGSARKALVLLHQVAGLESEAEQLDAVQKSDTREQAIALARLLVKPNAKWAEVAAFLKGFDEDPEGVRMLVLHYAASVLLGGGKLAERAYLILNAFETPFYDTKKPGLVRACYDVVSAR